MISLSVPYHRATIDALALYTHILDPKDRFPSDYRLGDTVDDFCVKCKRLTNHNIVSLRDLAPAKVRCCTCYGDHEYLKEQAPPPKPRKIPS